MLQLCSWNARGLGDDLKKVMLANLLVDSKPDALFIAETWYKPHHVPWVPDGFKPWMRNDRTTDTGGGGVAWLVRSDLKILDQRLSKPDDPAEWMALKVAGEGRSFFWMVGVYVPNGDAHWNSAFLDQFRAEGPTIVCGDFNAHHKLIGVPASGSRLHNVSGLAIADLFASNRFTLIGDNRATHRLGRRLDLWFCSPDITGCFSDYRVGGMYTSDHNATAVKIALKGARRALPSVRFDFSRANWRLFVRTLNSLLENIALPGEITPEELDRYNAAIVDAVKQAADAAIPKVAAHEVRCWRTNPKIRQNVALRHRLERLHKKTGDPAYQFAANRTHDKFEELVKAAEEASYTSKMVKMERSRRVNVSQFFRLYDEISTGDGSSIRKGVATLTAEDGSVAVDDGGKAELIGQHLGRQFKQPVSFAKKQTAKEHVASTEKMIREEPGTFKPLTAQTAQTAKAVSVTKRELIRAVKKLKLKAPGHDGISNLLLKRGSHMLWDHLLKLYNWTLAIGYVPSSWKLAIIVPIPRPGKDLTKPGGYRPVSLLPTIAKLLELVLALRLRDLFERHRLLPKHQSGFRRFRSTMDQLFRYAQTGMMARMHGDCMIGAFLDFEGAFNGVWHDGLRRKLADCKQLDRNLVRWLSSFLEGRKFQVRVGCELSQPFDIEAGVPQGSALSPILFAFFTADLIADPTSGFQALVASYADDVLIFAVSSSAKLARAQVQAALRKVQAWSELWLLKLNPSKCQVQQVGQGNPDGQPNGELELFMDPSDPATKLPTAELVTYLGVVFDSKLEFNDHVTKVEEDVKLRIGGLRRLCRRGSPISIASKRLLYLAAIRPAIEYGCAAFVHASHGTIDRLEVLQNEALRAVLGKPFDDQTESYALCRDAAVPSLRHRLTVCAARFGHRCLQAVPIVGELINRHRTSLVVGGTPLGKFLRMLPPLRP